MNAKGVTSTGGVRLFAETRFNHGAVPDRGDTKAWRQRAAKGIEAESGGNQTEEKGKSEDVCEGDGEGGRCGGARVKVGARQSPTVTSPQHTTHLA